jgi:hypothetical protein
MKLRGHRNPVEQEFVFVKNHGLMSDEATAVQGG